MTNELRFLNEVWTKLKAQGQGAYDEDHNTCRYRTTTNLKCAIGMFIEDEDYNPSLEGMGPPELLHVLPEWLASLDPWFLREVQQAHDDAALTTNFLMDLKVNLRDLAEEYHIEGFNPQ